MEPTQLALLGVIFGAFLIGSAMGFATTILAVTFGAQLLPLEQLLPVLAPLNIALACYLAIRYRRETAWPVLRRRLIPLVGAGVPIGLLLFNFREVGPLKLAFGLFVVVLAGSQLWMAHPEAPLRRGFGGALLVGGGIIHGLFGTGGPLIVYVLGREIADKGSFRSTLSTMWIPVNSALLVDYVLVGLYNGTVLTLSAAALVPVVCGVFFGELCHARLNPRRFKLAVWLLLLAGGVILSLRAALSLCA